MTITKPFKTALAVALVTIAIFLFSGSMTAQTFDYSIMHSFGAPRMGLYPWSPLLLDNRGHLYGTTEQEGTFGQGVIYEINTTGAEKTIYTFTGGADGGQPLAGLVSDPAGNLYGTTHLWGDLSCNAPLGCGTIFKLDSSHNFSVLHAFTQNEGYYADSALVRDQAGNLYGSLEFGSATFDGTVFKLDSLGNLTVLHNFTGGTDGAFPNGLIIDKVGNLYGTTQSGGTYGLGTVFKMDPAGHISTIYTFGSQGYNGGAGQVGALARDSAGNVYGATKAGGDYGDGTLFKLNLQSRTLTVLHSFNGPEGQYPNGSLILDSAGNLYGTTNAYGREEGQVAFMLDASGVYSILHDFGWTNPYAGLIIDRAGNLYGTTSAGGANDAGTVFKLTRQ